MIFKRGDKEIEVLFLQQRHYDLLKSNNLDLSSLMSLPSVKGVADEDCLDWLKFQRAVENQYCGFSSTVYGGRGKLSVDYLNMKGVVFQANYGTVINSTEQVTLQPCFAYYFFNDKLYVLNTANPVNDNMFNALQGNLASSLYKALVSTYSLFEFYFRNNKELNKTVKERGYVDPGFVIAKAIG